MIYIIQYYGFLKHYGYNKKKKSNQLFYFSRKKWINQNTNVLNFTKKYAYKNNFKTKNR